MAKLTDLLTELDKDIKKRTYNDICSLICSADKDEETSFELEAEILAMSIIEDICKDEWVCNLEVNTLITG